jgi:hypothetical protein
MKSIRRILLRLALRIVLSIPSWLPHPEIWAMLAGVVTGMFFCYAILYFVSNSFSF